MSKFLFVFLGCVVILLAVVSAAKAGVVVFTDRSAWEAAVGRPPEISDDYDDITADVYLNTSPDRGSYVPWSSYATGSRLDTYPPSVYAECNVDGTDFLLAFIRNDSFPEHVVFTFDRPVISWGVDLNPGDYNSKQIDFTTDAGDSGFYNTPSVARQTEFRGFVTTAPFTSVDFTVTSGFTAQGWDNFAAHLIPEPAAVSLLALSGLGLLLRRRR